ncbi:MAG: GNAT family N-acetyltransferase [Nanoarchaeota archaeon]|nr:GNAT family N-acetyltransferase [Nanoarchaeota archaeon]
MTDNLSIERVDKNNFDDFFSLIVKLAEFENLTPPDEKAKIRMKKHATQDNPYYEAYIGKLDGKTIGYTVFFMTYSSFLGKPTLYLEDLFIVEEHRKKGYGKTIFNFLFKEAKKRECGRMEWSALDWNTPAINFYEGLGAKKLKEWIYFRLTEDKIEKLAE